MPFSLQRSLESEQGRLAADGAFWVVRKELDSLARLPQDACFGRAGTGSGLPTMGAALPDSAPSNWPWTGDWEPGADRSPGQQSRAVTPQRELRMQSS